MTPMNCFFLLSQSNDSLNSLTSKDWISEWYSMIKTRYWVGQMSPFQDCKSCSRSPLLRHRHVPPSLWLCLYPQWLRLCCGLPDPSAPLCHPGSPSARLLLGLHLQCLHCSSPGYFLPILHPASFLPPSTPPWGLILAGRWISTWLSCSWLLPPSTPPWFLPLSPSPSLCLSPAPRPPPEPPLSLFSWTSLERGLFFSSACLWSSFPELPWLVHMFNNDLVYLC